MQSVVDVFLGWSHYDAAADTTDYYVRQLWDGKASAAVEAMGPKALARYARLCGMVLARAHARSGDATAISGYLGDDDSFDRADHGVRHRLRPDQRAGPRGRHGRHRLRRAGGPPRPLRPEGADVPPAAAWLAQGGPKLCSAMIAWPVSLTTKSMNCFPMSSFGSVEMVVIT